MSFTAVMSSPFSRLNLPVSPEGSGPIKEPWLPVLRLIICLDLIIRTFLQEILRVLWQERIRRLGVARTLILAEKLILF